MALPVEIGDLKTRISTERDPAKKQDLKTALTEKETLLNHKDDKAFYPGVKWQPCTKLDAAHPLLMDQTLVIGIDLNGIQTDRFKIINLNLTNQQGNPINPAPVRQSFGGSGGSTANLAGGPYFLSWPNQIPGDTISTVNVNVIYSPPLPGDRWLPNTVYPSGSVVTSDPSNGHYFTARVGGISSDSSPTFLSTAPATVVDGNVLWVDTGSNAPQGAQGGSITWAANLQVTPSKTVVYDPYNGHYYSAIGTTTTGAGVGATGLSPTDPFSLPSITDGSVVWADAGFKSPCGAPPCAGVNARATNTAYTAGDWVVQPSGHYYQAVVGGITRNDAFDLPIYQAPASVSDGTVSWKDIGPSAPPKAVPEIWKPFHTYESGASVRSSNGDYYQAVSQKATSGSIPSQPNFPITVVNSVTTEKRKDPKDPPLLLPVVWIDSGTAAPSGALTAPADQTVSLINLQFPQSHSLSYYNLASGVVYSFVRNRTYGLVCSPVSAAATGNCAVPGGAANSGSVTAVQTSASPSADPVLLFTAYPLPIDAEKHCGYSCLYKTWPGLSFGLSLANPSSSFYGGVSFELLRNIQVVGGLNAAKVTRLPPSSVPQPTSLLTNSGTPVSAVTIQQFTGKPFVGVTLNISGFIQSLFGGGGSKGSSSSGGS